jgi:hypothetical protein
MKGTTGQVDADHAAFEPAEGQAVQALAVGDQRHREVALGIAARGHLELDREAAAFGLVLPQRQAAPAVDGLLVGVVEGVSSKR